MSRDDLALLLARIAVMAGKSVAGIFGHKVETVWKPDASPVTNADKAAEAAIIPLLADALPGVPVVSEELVAAGCIPEIGERFVLVDPLDGTREFIAGRPEVTVNIALVENGRPTAGAVYAPLMGRLWFGGTEARVIDDSSGSRAGRGSVSAPHCSPQAAIDRLSRADQPLASRHRERGLFGSLAGHRETGHGLVTEVLFDRRGKSRTLPPSRTDTRVGHGRGPCCPCCGRGRCPYA